MSDNTKQSRRLKWWDNLKTEANQYLETPAGKVHVLTHQIDTLVTNGWDKIDGELQAQVMAVTAEMRDLLDKMRLADV
jgi:hypothetical protein